MEYLAPLIDTARQHPMLALGIALAVVAAYALLNRKPKIARDADARLAALRRDKADQYNKTRPLR